MIYQKSKPIWTSNCAVISKLSSLASLLETNEENLLRVASDIEKHYRLGKKLKKKSGNGYRQTHDAKPELKLIHELINRRILKQVVYPPYLFGGIHDMENPRSPKSNAAYHAGRKFLFKADIKSFFPSVTPPVIHKIWSDFFHFSPAVCECLTKLTMFRNFLPQGWKTSGYLANLVFLDAEARLEEKLSRQGLKYSRFVDDVAVSSSKPITKFEISNLIRQFNNMFKLKGLRLERTKLEILVPNVQMTVTGFVVNSDSPTILPERRRKIRAMVRKLEIEFRTLGDSQQYSKEWMKVSGLVGNVRSLHPNQGDGLKARLKNIKPIQL